MRRRRLALGVLALLLLGSCTAAGLSVAVGRGPSGSGTVTATADVGGDGRDATTTDALAAQTTTALGGGSGAATTAPPVRNVVPAATRTRPRTVVTGDALQDVLVTLAGSAAGLVPGRQGQTVDVVVTNDAANEDDLLLTLTAVGAFARGPAGSCGPGDLVVTAYDAGRPGAPVYALQRGESVVVPLPVLFVDRLDRDQTDCAGATFPLTLTMTAGVTS